MKQAPPPAAASRQRPATWICGGCGGGGGGGAAATSGGGSAWLVQPPAAASASTTMAAFAMRAVSDDTSLNPDMAGSNTPNCDRKDSPRKPRRYPGCATQCPTCANIPNRD